MSGEHPKDYYAKRNDSWRADPDRHKQANALRKKPGDYAPDKHPRDTDGNPICGAKKKSKKGGTLCTLPAGYRTDHQGYGKCSFHGGNTPTLRTSAAKYVGGEIIDRMTMAYGYGAPIDINPVEALLQEVRRTGGHVAWLADRISLWEMVDEDGNLTKPITEVQQQWIDLYHAERDRLVKVAKTALDAGVNERKIRLAEKQGEMMITVLNTAFEQLGLTVEQRRLIPSIMPGVLRSISEPALEFTEEPSVASQRLISD